MEEKKSIKISLKTYLISMFVMLIVIGILLGYILQTGKQINKEIADKNNYEKIIENDDDAKENLVENQQEEVIVEEVDKEITKETIKKEDETEENISDEEIKDILENYLNIFHGYGAQEQLLNSLDLMTFEEAQNYKADDDNYKITNISYAEFEKKIKNYTTLENFEKINKNGQFVQPHFKNVNGNVAYFDGGWTGVEYVVNDVTIKGEYLNSRYVANYYIIEGDVIGNETTLEFDIENCNGNTVISNCYFE